MRGLPADGTRAMRLLAGLFFAGYLAAGLAVYDDYGVSWDEEINADLGRRTYSYVAGRISGNFVPWAVVKRGMVAEQGPFFETILHALGEGLGLEDSRATLQMRHLATFLVFWLGTVAFYALLHQHLGDRRIALAGAALMVLTPRLFAHSFYNSKDAVLTALFMIGMLTMLRFAREPSRGALAAHALVCAAAVGIRVVGLALPAVTLVLVGLRFAGEDRSSRSALRTVTTSGAFLVVFALLALLFWPALWEDPAGSLLRTIGKVASARQVNNNFSLYMGSFVRVDQLPWHYLPVWMLVTIPPLHTLLFGAGLWTCGRGLLRAPPWDPQNARHLAFALLLFVPVLAVIAVRPILYDDWRHLYFVYPAFLVIAMTGLKRLVDHPMLRKPALVLVLLAVVHGFTTLVRYHPYQNVYFNFVAGDDVESRFELDYWGLSFREGLEYVLRTDPSDPLLVRASDNPGRLNALILDAPSRRRLKFVPLGEADWFLSNHRQPVQFAAFRERRYPYQNEQHAVRVEGATLLGIYKLRR